MGTTCSTAVEHGNSTVTLYSVLKDLERRGTEKRQFSWYASEGTYYYQLAQVSTCYLLLLQKEEWLSFTTRDNKKS